MSPLTQAISKPSEEAERSLWSELIPCVDSLQEFYEFSLQLEIMLESLIKILCQGDPIENIKQYQALARKFANVIHFAIVFDDLKMSKPDIQNDFSYYRRSLPKIKLQLGDDGVKVQDDLANKMSLFYAYPTPMMRSIITAMTNFVAQDNSKLQPISNCLSTMVNACINAVTQNSVNDKQFCLYVMVACLVLYDHVNEEGAFVKKSPINIKQVKKLIETDGGPIAEPLLNCLRYTTKHLNDESTPKGTRNLLNAN